MPILQLDAPTIGVVLILLNLVSAIVIFWASIERPAGGERMWAVSLILEILAVLLYLTQGTWSPILSVVIANGILVLAFSFKYLSLSRFTEKEPVWAWFAAPPILLTLIFAFLLESLHLRVVAVNSVLAIQCAALLWLMYINPIPGVTRSRRLMITYAGLAIAVFMLRLIAELASPSEGMNLFETNDVFTYSVLALLVLVVTSSYAIILVLREKLDAENQRLATLDPLTNICNRRAFIELAERELLRSYRTNRWPCLLMLDIDHFKDVNDSHGHQVGDLVLLKLSEMIVDRLRDLDVVGRYGGEEFCILLAETDEEGGMISADRLRAAVEAMEIETEKGPVKISTSIGVTHGRSGDTVDQLVARADKALYEAKREGRNQVMCA